MSAPVRSETKRCPRCRGIAFPDSDPDYVVCLHHGTLYMGVPPLDVPVPYSKTGEKVTRYCVDCGVPVTGRDTKRCKGCSGVALRGDPRLLHKARPQSRIVHAKGIGS